MRKTDLIQSGDNQIDITIPSGGSAIQPSWNSGQTPSTIKPGPIHRLTYYTKKGIRAKSIKIDPINDCTISTRENQYVLNFGKNKRSEGPKLLIKDLELLRDLDELRLRIGRLPKEEQEKLTDGLTEELLLINKKQKSENGKPTEKLEKGLTDLFRLRILHQGNGDYLAYILSAGQSIVDCNDYFALKNGDVASEPDPPFQNEERYKYPLNIILYGPPGTGKTYSTMAHAIKIIDPKTKADDVVGDENKLIKRFNELQTDGKQQIRFITFHQSYGYEDFIEGIKPVCKSECYDRIDESKDETENEKSVNELRYELESGIFKNVCDDAKKNPRHNYVLIIDEINRGNVSKIFGELITLIEESKRLGEQESTEVKLPYSQESFGVPNNLYIIGTMNTADHSLTRIDAALRRRFHFIEMMPDYDVLKEAKIKIDEDTNIDIPALLEKMNKRIEYLLDRDHQIGHAYFCKLNKTENQNIDTLADIFKNKIVPLLQEYFYDDYKKIQLVLGDSGTDVDKDFILSKDLKTENPFTQERPDEAAETTYCINDNAFKNPLAYLKMYPGSSEKKSKNTDPGTTTE